MTDTGNTQVPSNNQSDSTAEPQTIAEAAEQFELQFQKENSSGATDATAKDTTDESVEEQKPETEVSKSETKEPSEEATKKPEFSDPNMEARFTQRMQELSEKEKLYELGLNKIKTYDELLKNDKVVNLLRREYLNEGKEDDMSDDDFLMLTSDKKKFNEFIKQKITQTAAELIKPTQQRLAEVNEQLRDSQLMQDIEAFENAKDNDGKLLHPDFDELVNSKKIDPFLMKLKGANISELEKLELAYKLAKIENVDNEVKKKAHNIVQQKKQAIGEKGNTAQVKLSNKEATSLREFYDLQAKELGIE